MSPETARRQGSRRARAGGFTHCVLYDIPANVAALEPNLPTQERVSGIGVQGKNDSGRIGYMGPCPPSRTHRYFVRLYALECNGSGDAS